MKPRVLVAGPAPPAMGGIASVIQLAFDSDLAKRFELMRFATSEPRYGPRGFAGRATNTALARGLGFDGAFNLEARAQLRDFASALAERPALAHVHTFHGWDFWLGARMAAAARRRGIPSLLHVHGNFDVVYPRWSALRRAAFRRALAVPDRLVVLSHSWRNWFASHLDLARIEVVPNAVDASRFRPRRPAASEAPQLLFVGTRDARIKGAYELLAAAPAILRELPDARFVFVGEDPEQLEARQVRGTPLAAHVAFVGRQRADEMVGRYESADLLLLPSHREGLPMALLEGMAAGLAIVASRLHAIAEVLPAEGGALVAPGDGDALGHATIEWLRDPVRRARAGAANRARVEREFDRPRYAERLAALYDRVLETPR